MGRGDDRRPANGNEGRKETTLIFRVFVANEILFFISIISLFHFLNFQVMSIKFRMYQDNRKNSKRKGFWYARAVSPDLVGVKDLAQRISERCTVTEPDILAVISALVFEMNQVLKDGNRVKLDGLGTFRVGIHSQGVEKAKDFNAQRDIYGAHVLFAPTVTVDAMHRRVKNLISGLRIQEAVQYDAPKTAEKAKDKGKKKDNKPSAGPEPEANTPSTEAHA